MMKETNMEHYRSEIEELLESGNGLLPAIIDNKPAYCRGRDCNECPTYGQSESCSVAFVKWLMSEYKFEPVLTAREKAFVEFAQEGWLARDIDGVMHWFMSEPYRCEDEDYRCWNGPVHAFTFKKLNEIFPFITWDEEPWSVEELRKLKALEYNPEVVTLKKGGTV